jgi:hypothetical protein
VGWQTGVKVSVAPDDESKEMLASKPREVRAEWRNMWHLKQV